VYSIHVAETQAQHLADQVIILPIALAVAALRGSQAIITTIIHPIHLHLTKENINSRTHHQHGRIGGLDFGLVLLLVV
jgi:hypothetical protein